MRAFRLNEWGAAPGWVEIDDPQPGPGQVRVRVGGVGLCHSDLTIAAMTADVAGLVGWTVPFTLGHETAGWVDSIGPDTTLPSGIAVGAAVALMSPNACGTCAACLAGADSRCEQGTSGRGYGRDGGLATYVLARPSELIGLGSLDPVTSGVLTDAAATAHHGFARVAGRLGPGRTALVIGVGGLGQFAVQMLASVDGTEVLAVDSVEEKRVFAETLGATGLERAPRRASVDVVLDFVGVDETIGQGLAALRPGGAYGLVGAGGGTLRAPWWGSIPNDAEVFTYQGSGRADLDAVVAMAQRGAIVPHVEVFSPDELRDALAALDAGTLSGRAVIEMGTD